MTERWEFGVEPLDQTVEAAGLLRRVTSLVLSMEQPDESVEALLADLRRAEAALSARVPASAAPRVGEGAGGDGRVYVDHARHIGAFDPCFPEYQLSVEGDRATGTVTFPVAFEGPPGIVHGGFLAVLFDCVMQHHNCDAGTAGKTTALSVRYRRPAPLLTPLTFELALRHDGDRIHNAGTLHHGDRLLCEAEMDAVAGVRANLPAVDPRRPAP